MSAADILIAARGLIADRGSWCQGAFAMTADSRTVGARNNQAVRFCGTGALDRALQGSTGIAIAQKVEQALDRAARELHPAIPEELYALVWVNDRIGHAAILKVYDRAIELAGEEERT